MYDTREEIIEDLKKNTLFEEDKNLTSGIIFYVRKNTKLKEAIEKLTGLSDCREAELIYKLVHPEASKYCQVCGKEVQFSNYYLGYKKACCKKHADILSAKKSAETKQERYGDTGYNNKEKSAQTKLERYGNAHWTNTEKALQTRVERYGTLSYNNMEKHQQTCIERYGVKNPTLNPEVREKQLNTFREKYGVSAPMQSELVKQHYKQNSIQRRGYEWHLQDPKWRKGHKPIGQTKNEKLIEEFLKNRGFNYQYEYSINGKNFDFAIFDSEGKLTILIETDGGYFHGLYSDYDGKNVRGETDCERFEKVPEGVKFLVFDEKSKPEDIFSSVLETFNINYESWIQTIISNLPKDFPYPAYDEKRMKGDYKKLGYYTYNEHQHLATSVIKNFHKSIYKSHVGNKPSPVEAWNDSKLLEKCVRNRFIYANKLSSQNIADGFNVCKLAPKVSVFNPSLARYLIQKYLGSYDEIFDPFSGFSGRMLGTTSLGKKYIGQDINEEHVEESNQIINFLDLNAQVETKDIFKSTGEYKCLFTCSPYELKETWNNKEQKSLTCDEWIQECLSRFKCEKYLFVVDNTEQYKDYIVEELTNRSHFGSNKEYVVLI